uniref:Uncharacterized protein n=1 Tax=Oryza sativa subsp. japonica TaxID=39947 RepID=Q6ERR5_ORYSJ|nr:hypothetical protein [Oryza sativa Japonica Group]BAD33481.1 hypothetical protein [Oryza sativa Japonica Group]
MDGRMDGHGRTAMADQVPRERERELTEREVSTQRQAASVVFFVATASRGHRHRFSSPPHPSIHPRHTIPSSTTAIQSRINTVTKHQRERERERGKDDHPVKQVRLWRKEPRRGQIWGGLVFFFLKPFRWSRP